MSTRAYKHGLLAPTEGAERVRQQMRAAHNYSNTLTRIEIERRAAVREAMSGHATIASLEVAARAADAEVGRLVSIANAAKAAARSHKAPIDKAALATARAAKKAAVTAFREARAAAREDSAMQGRLDEIQELAKALVCSARKYSGLYWGTYLLVEAAADASHKTLPLYDGAEPNDPRFCRWDGEGRIGVQVQRGADASALVDGESTPIRIESAPLGKKADPQSKRSAKNRRVVLAMRVGSTDNGKPVFARWPMVMHRQFPKGARVKGASVHLRMVGPREEWSVSIVLDTTACASVGTAPSAGIVGLDLGWRRDGDGVRICAWNAGAEQGKLELPQSLIDSQRKVHELQRIRDKNFNGAREALAASLAGVVCPDWLAKDLRTLAQWRSADRLARLARHWRKNRFDGDVAAYEALETWRYHDYHIWTWESSQRESVLRWRREVFRVFAADLARRFAVLALEAESKAEKQERDSRERARKVREKEHAQQQQAEPYFDLSKFAARPLVEDEETKDGVLRAWRTLFAPSKLRLWLINAFGPTRVRKVDAAYTTVTCADCGHIDEWENPAALLHVCSKCGNEWDCDENAARVIRARAIASDGVGPQKPVDDRNGEDGNGSKEMAESKWSKAARMKRERDARKGTARETAAKAAE